MAVRPMAVDTGLKAVVVPKGVAVELEASLTIMIILASLLIVVLIFSDETGRKDQGYAGGGDTEGKYGDGGGGCK